jgi:hypothetical protein
MARRGRSIIRKGVNMCHYIVAELGFIVPGRGEGLVGNHDVGTHLLDGFVRDRKA